MSGNFLEHPAPTTGHDSGIDNEALSRGLFDDRKKHLPILFVQVRGNIYELDLWKHVYCPNHFIRCEREDQQYQISVVELQFIP